MIRKNLHRVTCKYAEIFCWKYVSSFCSAKATHIFSAKDIRILYIESAKTVNEMTLNELVKLTTFWKTGPWNLSTQCRLIRRRVLWRLILVCTVCQCPSPGFTDNPLCTALWRHSDKNCTAIGNSYLDFLPTRGLISLVNNNHMDNTIKEILVYVARL